MGTRTKRREPNRVAVNPRAFSSSHVHHVGNNVLGPITSVDLAGAERVAAGIEWGTLINRSVGLNG